MTQSGAGELKLSNAVAGNALALPPEEEMAVSRLYIMRLVLMCKKSENKGPRRKTLFVLRLNLKENGLEWIAYNEKSIIYSKLDLPTKFHPNQTKIAKVCYWGGFWMGG